MTTTEQEIAGIVARITKTPAERILPDMDLRVALNVDSLQGLQIVAAIEHHFGMDVPDDELDNYATVRAISATVDRLRARP
jgi:acyl carrier protein